MICANYVPAAQHVLFKQDVTMIIFLVRSFITYIRAVAKISRSQVYAIRRQGIVVLEVLLALFSFCFL